MLKFATSQQQRIEDGRLITGRGAYTDDVQLPGMVYGVTVRSPHGHARIVEIVTADAAAMPGVALVLTAADLAHMTPMPAMMLGKLGTPRPVLANGHVRFVGDPVAFVVAETREAARAAAEAVIVEYDDLPAIATIDEAVAPDAPPVWAHAPGNTLFAWEVGDEPATQAALAAAPHVTRLRIVQNRIAPTSMEVRAAVAELGEDGRTTLHVGSQGVTGMRKALAGVLGVVPETLRLITKDVGGGFGMKGFIYPEYALVIEAARRLNRPVKWTGERGDAFQTDTHGRDMVSDAALATDREGRILGLKVETWSNLGAYQSEFGAAIQTWAGGRIMGGVYRIPAIHNRVHGVVTNTAPVDAYRGAGRPESAYVMERLIEAAARDLNIGVDEIRRRNLLTPAELPHDNRIGLTFDVGDFPHLLDRALGEADWQGFSARRATASARGLRYGRGICYYVEIAGGGSTQEFADVRVSPGGLIEAAIGTQSNGQGHETAYARLLADKLGIDVDQVRIVQGDTDRMEVGHGTGGSRSLQWGGGAAWVAAEDLIERGRGLAAELLGVTQTQYEAGVFRASGTNATRTWTEVAVARPGALDGRARYAPANPAPTFPNGCHIAEVSLNPRTGHVAVERYTVVDDFGVLLNPELVVGQIHGGVAQGLGQVLLENVVYGDGAQLVTGSFMDYGIPRAGDMPIAIAFDVSNTLSPTNPMGVKGCGEAGTIGALPSLMNAIIDALDGVQVEMPATPEKLWRACEGLKRAA